MIMDPFRTEKKIAAFTCFILGIALIFVILTTPGCKSSNMPPMDVTFWAGDSSHSAIVRSQDKEKIECSLSEFDNYACLSYQDIQKIYDTMLQCKDWPMLATYRQLKRFERKNKGVIQHVLQARDASMESTRN